MGNGCRFPSLKSFVDFSLSNISSLNSFKDKQILDLKSYKNKLDSLIKLSLLINISSNSDNDNATHFPCLKKS